MDAGSSACRASPSEHGGPPKGILRRYGGTLEVVSRATDILMVISAGVLAWRLVANDWPTQHTILGIALLAIPVWLLSAAFAGLYRPWRGQSLVKQGRSVLTVVAIALALAVTLILARGHEPDTYLFYWAGIAALLVLIARGAIHTTLRVLRRRGYNQRHIVIVGTGGAAELARKRVQENAWLGFNIVGVFEPPASDADPMRSEAPITETYPNLTRKLASQDIDQVWIAMALREEDQIRRIIHDLRHHTVDICFVPDIFGFELLNHRISDVAGLPIIDLSTTPMRGVNLVLKEVEDRTLAALGLVILSPLLALLALAVKLSSPGPVFYRQERVGWNGETFEMLKFRSMPVNAEVDTGPVWARAGEKRATPIGGFLRRTSLDELPQLINVLRGEMSLVGPRPERPNFVARFKEEIPSYMKKHMVKAGMTGWAQIHGYRGDTSLEQRIKHDLYYIDNWSLTLDLRIILATFAKGFLNPNAY